ncbi:kinase-like domain-containing protein, partial [Chlamydoabsidia padenii]
MEPENLPLNKTSHSLGHRRQASKGLGIITNSDTLVNSETKNTTTPIVKCTKNASFFETSDLATPQPPPRLRPLDIFKDTKSPTAPTPLEPSTSYASRLRNIVATMNHDKHQDNLLSTSANSTPLPDTKQKDDITATTLDTTQAKVRRAKSYRFKPPYYDDDDDDGIMALPSPLPTSTTSSSSNRLPHQIHVLHPTHHKYITSGSHPTPIIPTKMTNNNSASPHSPMTPPSPSASTSIPILAISPTFVHKNDVIPQLSEHPMLGDMIESTCNDKLRGGNMVRELSQSSTLPTLGNKDGDEDLIDKQLGDFYIRRLLGMGAFSKVYLAERHVDDDRTELLAIKTINKVGMQKNPRVRSSIEREVGVLKFIDHPHIVHIEATMETEHSLCIILEYAKGVELFSFVQQLHQQLHATNEKVNEILVKRIFLQLVSVVKWMHKHNIVHRDLKLENVLIHMDQDEPILKVTDFGLARVIDPESPILTTRCGSEEYAAPEIVQSKGYDGRQTDTWALGVILYSLLVGYLPFRYDPSKGERVTQMFYRIVRAQIKWPKVWDLEQQHLAISSQAKNVVERILVRQP